VPVASGVPCAARPSASAHPSTQAIQSARGVFTSDVLAALVRIDERAQFWRQKSGQKEAGGLDAVTRAFARREFERAARLSAALATSEDQETRQAAFTWLGRSEHARGNDEAASQAFEKAYTLGARDADLSAFLGNAAFQAAHWKKAQQLLAGAFDASAKTSLLPFLVRAAQNAGDTLSADRYLLAYLERKGLDDTARELIESDVPR